jgi:hypothetical protein
MKWKYNNFIVVSDVHNGTRVAEVDLGRCDRYPCVDIVVGWLYAVPKIHVTVWMAPGFINAGKKSGKKQKQNEYRLLEKAHMSSSRLGKAPRQPRSRPSKQGGGGVIRGGVVGPNGEGGGPVVVAE